MPRPRLGKVRVTMKMPPDLLNRVDRLRGPTDRSSFVEMVLEKYMAAGKGNGKK